MGQVLHRRATTTEAVRRAIQQSQASIAGLAKQYGINPKTVQKWKKRSLVHDAPNGIAHRLTKLNHSWRNGQVERMNRTLKEATVKRYYYDSHKQLKEHLQAFVPAHNFAKRLKRLQGLTAYEYICRIWAKEPSDSRKIHTTTSWD